MTSDRSVRGFRAILSAVLLTGLVASVLPAAAVTAQDPATSLGEANAFLGNVPGLKLEQLSIYSDAIGDAEPGADVAWAAAGEIEFTNKLRKWLKQLVESEYGWGQLPAKDVRLLITFVGMEQPPTRDGDSTAVIHLGLGGDDSLVQAGLQVSPGNGDRLVHSFGLWQRDGQYYTQNGTSPVTVGGVSWFGDPAKGAGGIVQPDGVIVNVVPLQKMTRHFRINSESTSPFSTAPNGTSSDIVFGFAGNERIRRDGSPTDKLVECFSTFVSPLASGARQVPVNLQLATPLDAETLSSAVKLAGFGEGGGALGPIEGVWTSFPEAGLHRGLFEITDAAVASVAVLAGDDVAGGAAVAAVPGGTMLLAADDVARPVDPYTVARTIARMNGMSRISLHSIGIGTGNDHCGKVVSDDLDVCDASLLAAMTEGLDGTLSGLELTGESQPSQDGEQCLVSAGGTPIGVLIFGNEPVKPENLSPIADASGCGTSPMEGSRDGRVVECDEFVAWLWRGLIPAASLADLDGGMGIIQTLLLFRPLPVTPADDEFDANQPISIDTDFLASLEAPMSAMDALVQQSEFRLAIPSAALPG